LLASGGSNIVRESKKVLQNTPYPVAGKWRASCIASRRNGTGNSLSGGFGRIEGKLQWKKEEAYRQECGYHHGLLSDSFCQSKCLREDA
jgi:hypothetical protein